MKSWARAEPMISLLFLVFLYVVIFFPFYFYFSFFPKKIGFGTAGQKCQNMIKKSSLFGSFFFQKSQFFWKKKKKFTFLRGTKFVPPLPPAEKGFRQGFETENDITRPSRAISNLRIHSFILTFRCGAAYQP